MSFVKSLFCAVVVAAACIGCASADPDMTHADPAVDPAALTPPPTVTNTNQCIKDLGGIQVCQDRNVLGLPNDLQACCDGVRALATDRCECNPAISTLLGPNGTQIYQLEPLCRLIQFSQWKSITPRIFRSCKPLETHNYGCEKTDMEMDGARLQSILAFQSLFAGATDENMCFDTPTFASKMATVAESDVRVSVPYGIGTYTGIHDVSEYLGMSFSGLTHGFWQNNTTPDRTKRARLDVSADGSLWTSGSTLGGDFVRGKLPYTDAYIEQAAKFNGCGTLVAGYTVLPTDGMAFWIERYVQGADLSKRWGLEDICRYHTKFCADDPTTRQYESEQECLDYLGQLPLYTEKCGPNRPLNGHSISCKFKHHFMIPANPKLHCAHIGKVGQSDVNHHMKCDDDMECSDDEGQNAWPPITHIGANTPQEVIDVYNENNVGFETEPFGCAVPSTEVGGHQH
jgi:hypothetical protein